MKERIEYIDALRGFTMLLVVYAHVRYFGYHEDDTNIINSFNSIFLLIRMPLFFFVSGFLFYRNEWNKPILQSFIKKKAEIQIIPATLFMFIYAFIFNYDIKRLIFSYHKLGYWFTFTLFSFFIIYFIMNYILMKIKIREYLKDTLWILLAIIIHFATTNKCMQYMGINIIISDMLGIILFKYYIFFILGTLTRKYFAIFLEYTRKPYFSTLIIFAFFSLLTPTMKYNLSIKNVWTSHLLFLYFGVLGIYLTFLYFNRYQYIYSNQTFIGRYLQFIGKRTLDIYLLHYFFLPRNLGWMGKLFTNFSNPCIELFISLCISILVICMCIVVSDIIRVSPILGKFLLGAKFENNYTSNDHIVKS